MAAPPVVLPCACTGCLALSCVVSPKTPSEYFTDMTAQCPLNQSRLSEVEGSVAEVRKQYTREYRERRRLFNVVQVTPPGMLVVSYETKGLSLRDE